MRIQPYTSALEPAVKAFNRRLRTGETQHGRFPESYIPKLFKTGSKTPYQELFVVVDGEEVRGGYQLTNSQFVFNGMVADVAHGPQITISEGLINPRYSMVGALEVRDALERQPLMYTLGIGGMEQRLTKLLIALRFKVCPLPFYFHVSSPFTFLDNIAYLRRRKWKSIALDVLRFSGLGSLAVTASQARLPTYTSAMAAQLVDKFDCWADVLWQRCKDRYSFLAVRNSETLNVLYPPSEPRFLRLQVCQNGDSIGWLVMLDTKMSNNKYFGNMRVGSIVNCLAAPEHASELIVWGRRFLTERGVDIIVSNHSSRVWRKALVSAGFLRGPSNFILALSPALSSALQHSNKLNDTIYMMRGDGDGIGGLL
jgi:hypothetical protein